MAECKEATTSRKSAHNTKKRSYRPSPEHPCFSYLEKNRDFEIFGIISCNPKWATFRSSEVPSIVLRPFPHPARVCSMPLPSS